MKNFISEASAEVKTFFNTNKEEVFLLFLKISCLVLFCVFPKFMLSILIACAALVLILIFLPYAIFDSEEESGLKFTVADIRKDTKYPICKPVILYTWYIFISILTVIAAYITIKIIING